MLTFTISIRLTGPMGEEGEEVEEKDIDWKVGDNPPSEYLDDACLAVLSVIMDGKELAHILTEFHNLSYAYRSNRSCVWRGEMARFIFDNL